MNEHQRETAFLRHIILYDDTDEHRELEKKIAQVQRDQRCVERATSVTALFPLLAVTGFAYGAILEENFPYGGSQFIIRVICELGVASLICLAVFASVLTVYRRKLNRLREECRHLVRRFLESRLGTPPKAARMSDRGPGQPHAAAPASDGSDFTSGVESLPTWAAGSERKREPFRPDEIVTATASKQT